MRGFEELIKYLDLMCHVCRNLRQNSLSQIWVDVSRSATDIYCTGQCHIRKPRPATDILHNIVTKLELLEVKP